MSRGMPLLTQVTRVSPPCPPASWSAMLASQIARYSGGERGLLGAADGLGLVPADAGTGGAPPGSRPIRIFGLVECRGAGERQQQRRRPRNSADRASVDKHDRPPGSRKPVGRTRYTHCGGRRKGIGLELGVERRPKTRFGVPENEKVRARANCRQRPPNPGGEIQIIRCPQIVIARRTAPPAGDAARACPATGTASRDSGARENARPGLTTHAAQCRFRSRRCRTATCRRRRWRMFVRRRRPPALPGS